MSFKNLKRGEIARGKVVPFIPSADEYPGMVINIECLLTSERWQTFLATSPNPVSFAGDTPEDEARRREYIARFAVTTIDGCEHDDGSALQQTAEEHVAIVGALPRDIFDRLFTASASARKFREPVDTSDLAKK